MAMETKGAPPEKPKSSSSALARVAKYAGVRLVVLFLTVVVGIYLVVLVANMGGYVDQIRLGNINQQVSLEISQDKSPEMRSMSAEAKQQMIRERVAVEVKRQGLDKPFIVRSFGYLKGAITLDLGFATDMSSDSGSRQVRLILLERLPPTLLMW
ncbi:MAG: ABC transporter permease, partial [Anaerolineae bacterium]|nr:ABC transporter permease [Anaerolineae bacterium]